VNCPPQLSTDLRNTRPLISRLGVLPFASRPQAHRGPAEENLQAASPQQRPEGPRLLLCSCIGRRSATHRPRVPHAWHPDRMPASPARVPPLLFITTGTGPRERDPPAETPRNSIAGLRKIGYKSGNVYNINNSIPVKRGGTGESYLLRRLARLDKDNGTEWKTTNIFVLLPGQGKGGGRGDKLPNTFGSLSKISAFFTVSLHIHSHTSKHPVTRMLQS